MEIINGIIRKIVIGDIKNGITYVVGQPIMRGQAKISAIVQDEMYFIRYKMLKFNIYIKREGSETSELWKAFFELTGVEYNIDYKDEYEVN
jgi:uncharacterized lipoprotein YehR (DUF1307 family)|tara:strand:- start:3964 stop:4236 length:273 start_codon:yes stop_codon:yes gene_type:complete